MEHEINSTNSLSQKGLLLSGYFTFIKNFKSSSKVSIEQNDHNNQVYRYLRETKKKCMIYLF